MKLITERFNAEFFSIFRCSNEKDCNGFTMDITRESYCSLVQNVTAETDGQTAGIVYKKGAIC